MSPDALAARQAGEALRAHLRPLWRRLHESDLAFHAIRQLPDPLSTALCRHTTLFALRALTSAGWTGWSAQDGAIPHAGMLRVPGYAKDLDEARHCWLAHESGLWLDLAADQFGLPPILSGTSHDDAFAHHRPRPGPPPLRSLLRTIRNWEGDPMGTWPPSDLSAIRNDRARLLAGLARLVPGQLPP